MMKEEDLTNNKELIKILDGKINITHTAFKGSYVLSWDDIVKIYKLGAQSKLQALKEEVEEMASFTIDNQFQDGYKKALAGVINRINNYQKND